jgi:predicted transport protein
MSFQAYLDTIREKTGKTADDFVELAREKGLLVDGVKAGPVIEWLDQEYGLGRGHAMALVSVFRERLDGHTTKEDRIDKQFAGAKSVWQLAYDELMAVVMKFGDDVSVQPTDSYIGILRGKKKFAIVATSAKRMDVGLKLKDKEPTERLAPAGTWNSMVTHRVQLFDGAEIDDELVGWLREAYDRA